MSHYVFPCWAPGLWLAAALLCPAPGQATTLRVCIDVHPHPPFIMPDGSGVTGRLVARAAREARFKIEFHAVPLERCRAEAENNRVHAFPMMPYIPGALPIARYPMRKGAPDPARATMRAQIMLYQRVGGPVRWNGKRITGLVRPVLLPSGSMAMRAALTNVGAPMDEQGRSLAANLAKLVAGRGDAAAGVRDEGVRLLQLPQFAGKLEMLPLPLFEQPYYLVVTNSFYASHGPQVEAMWNAIGRSNKSAKTLKE